MTFSVSVSEKRSAWELLFGARNEGARCRDGQIEKYIFQIAKISALWSKWSISEHLHESI